MRVVGVGPPKTGSPGARTLSGAVMERYFYRERLFLSGRKRAFFYQKARGPVELGS